jgi:hypothetical protein
MLADLRDGLLHPRVPEGRAGHAPSAAPSAAPPWPAILPSAWPGPPPCYPDDLLVVGAGRRGVLTQAISAKVCHYCVAHAHCPVLTVRPPDFARELRRGPLTWMFRHRPLTPDQVLQNPGRRHKPGPGSHCGHPP